MTDSERIWREEQKERGWVMPAASWWKRLPVIRHFRSAYHRARAERAAAEWGRIGIGLGRPNQFDLWVCFGMWLGEERSK